MADERELVQYVHQVIGAELSAAQADALAAYYAGLSQAVATFAADQLRAFEPPLRSVPGPTAPSPGRAR